MPKQMRSDKEIAAEIKQLRYLRGVVPPRTMFGDSNFDKIDAEINVLEMKLDEADCAREYLQTDDEETEPSDEQYEIESCARDASYWLYKEVGHDDAPSVGWASLDPKQKKAKVAKPESKLKTKKKKA